MGGTPSKPAALPAFVPDFSRATLTGEEVMRQSQIFASQSAQAASKAAAAAAAASGQFYTKVIYGVGGLIFVIGIVIAVLCIHDVIVRQWGGQTFILPGAPVTPPTKNDPATALIIQTATYGAATSPVDVSSFLRTQVINAGGSSLPSFTVGYAALGLSTPPSTSQNVLNVSWSYGYDTSPHQTSATDGSVFPTLPTSSAAPAQQKASAPAKPPLMGNVWNYFSGSGSGNLLSKLLDATTTSSVSASSAPLSSENQGNYGVQWWMFVKDWNYGYGKEKSVMYRPDATNGSVANPNVTLHPTENTLRVAVSIFPASEGGAGNSEPAPAGHSGSTDDVFICEVPNIPLQAWFSVSMTVFERNLDVYIDGKLVKSCFLPGVPKPAVGDIQLTKDGGFSGYMCDMYHYPRMLTPSDAIAFFTAGTPCSSASQTTPSSAAAATGYSVKFGVYDTVGKEVQEYTF